MKYFIYNSKNELIYESYKVYEDSEWCAKIAKKHLLIGQLAGNGAYRYEIKGITV